MVVEKSGKRLNSASELELLREEIKRSASARTRTVTICCGTGCLAYGGAKVAQAFRDEIINRGLASEVEIKTTGCHGFCERGPLVVIRPENILYQRVKPADVPQVIDETVNGGKVIDRLLYTIPGTKQKVTYEHDVPFYKKQMRLVFGANGYIDPTVIEDYIGCGGYAALSKTLFEMTPDEVVDEVKKSGLRGRGGGGFATGAKWQSTREAHGDPKYVICNCDEGDPGAFMDRSLMEGNPHAIIEGMVIAAYAIGAHLGYIYIRNEYPVAVKHAEKAIAQAEAMGLLGENILGSGFSFSVKINRGGGAFVCGESTALMASVEGRVGEPRAKYIHTSEKGLWDQPTVLNNVETLANVPLIINRGAQWYSSIGTANSKGTKIFSLVGKVNNTGLIEVPMGITLEEIVYGIGGGIPKNKKFKAIQTGGPSGGCLPASKLDMPVDFDELTRAGSMMGSGAMIVMDEDNCMVDIARYFLSFLEGESCGKCVPCREGLKRMRQILDRIISGQGQPDDIELLENLSETLTWGALCGLGGGAANPIMSTLRYFREEYEAHIIEKRCPAGVCKPLISYNIINEKCPNCTLCIKACPAGAITGQGKKLPVILDQVKCTKCGACYDVCRLGAVEVR
ncbi:NADH-ubiquinone oxidoreductase-F iron-sulfur binding region domain-containing protein [Dehalogenimonas alkenigignens]|uniref:NADH:ubiquinone oxidoreductase, NADH-binding (51 kD) subunit n=1 Tax=Dehalogenimonas alkenigignens TaxID=1217799 RepID=A0A0W0GIW3_9CHLR|nr:NADH-ubiquinone oxidoreductase-F iron-sulfur binding region domain-containing protein [Dehalogenimonas alkenigignens]KTB48506.1 NADH:ubiquinone oxidoreductase, NADH-binding (51 kD) subunit [Dehalogenimonas alkenigignens]PVV85046.1 NADH-quinone oxidoreductase subunit F [Dehalogenimonas alkenigignens]